MGYSLGYRRVAARRMAPGLEGLRALAAEPMALDLPAPVAGVYDLAFLRSSLA